MTIKIDYPQRVTAGLNEDISAKFILDLQQATEIDALWLVFLNQVAELAVIKNAHMLYRAGLLTEALDFSNGQVIVKPLDGFPLAEGHRDFEVQITARQILVFKQEHGQVIQMEVFLDTTATPSPTQDQLAPLATLVPIFANQLFLLLQIKNYEFNAIKDDITMAYNQNYLKAFMYNEIERAKRYGTIFSVVFFDLDNLKAINEQYGHLVGTEVLKEVATILRSQVRKVDLLSRFGGDEFVIVLLHAEPTKALDVCLRIQKSINQHVFMESKNLNIKITGCFGISSFPEHGSTVEELIGKSDMAMYDVKHQGKNGIKIYKEEKKDTI